MIVKPGEIFEMPPNAIHCIENLAKLPSRALHCYGGNFKELDDVRNIWDNTAKRGKIPFSMPGMMKTSIERMAIEGNGDGLNGIKMAVPKLAPLVEAVQQAHASST